MFFCTAATGYFLGRNTETVLEAIITGFIALMLVVKMMASADKMEIYIIVPIAVAACAALFYYLAQQIWANSNTGQPS